ncbi:hypothetical protein J3E72DRAFT_8154 [Bipolaris maydis]|uniref:uncharacterized protein n=1 Tax=Cochliobolus heterostrophus TaxID=5016 RepID=UPI0024D684E2|nr:hypothetical protein J3E73DRAFT_10618 [Bipolaris maydis]KAJ5058538.1 hypothetical protein J3E74DRAFT_7371 [Bipolaris maydis]KAJ6195781.1 hypothetical protein J3E72DRAFT_8154 [Bipolaris maydis]KAJ6206568.1 hypothetical protein PSV09DRAFT_2009907 [Bipolaris maydis]KAJ6269268.1 hypothetical protein PSV08DRAFT_7182 [Bipolaris maydis]
MVCRRATVFAYWRYPHRLLFFFFLEGLHCSSNHLLYKPFLLFSSHSSSYSYQYLFRFLSVAIVGLTTLRCSLFWHSLVSNSVGQDSTFFLHFHKRFNR